jgi:molecular chaperone DnaK
VGELSRERNLPKLDRENPASHRALCKLKAACEQTKIELSRQESATLSVSELCDDETGNVVNVDLVVARADFAQLIEPFVVRSLAVVRNLLSRNQRHADNVARVVCVGGPTLIPSLRERISSFFGGRVAEGVDPMTAVARGAALYAATIGLSARPAPASVTAQRGLALRIEFPPVTADAEPFVVGRFLPAHGERLPERVRIVRQDGGVVFGDAPISAEGSFVLQVALVRHQQNHFQVQAVDGAGKDMALATSRFAIVHGVSVADPPLSRSVGLWRMDGAWRAAGLGHVHRV